MPGGTDTAKYSNNSAGSKISVGPKTTLAVASFDPDGFIALEKGRTMGYVTFQTGVDSNQAKRIKYWATCTEIEKASPRQLMVTLPDGSYKIAIFTTNVTKDGPGFTEKTIKGREVSLTGTLTSSPDQTNGGGTGTADYSNNTVEPRTSLVVASFDPNGYRLKDGSIKVKVKFSEAGVDPSQAVGFNHWMSCTEGDMAGPRQFSATLEPAGLYKEINFKTSTTEDGLAITEKVTEHREVSLEGTMTYYPHGTTDEETEGRT